VTAGGDRQILHEVIRRHSWAARDAEDRGEPAHLLERLTDDPAFAAIDAVRLRAELDPRRYVGRAPDQVREFVALTLSPLLDRLKPYAVDDQAEVTV